MRYGMSLGGGARSVEAGLAQIDALEACGVNTVWSGQLFGMDALTLFAMAGPRTSRLRFGTAVVPTYSRHPMVLASQALTTQAATGGRLLLGVGSSHQVLVEDALGLAYQRPAAQLREYLGVLARLLAGERFAFHGEFVHADSTTRFGRTAVGGATAPPIYVGTMFPQSLRAAAELAAGVVTWLVGPRTLSDVLLPTVTVAANEAGRARPELVAGIPVAVCDPGDTARHRAIVNNRLDTFAQLPVYQRVLAREGATRPADLAAIGDERTVTEALTRFAGAGADETYGVCFSDDDTFRRTAALLGTLARTP